MERAIGFKRGHGTTERRAGRRVVGGRGDVDLDSAKTSSTAPTEVCIRCHRCANRLAQQLWTQFERKTYT